jgi:hypothetical protein
MTEVNDVIDGRVEDLKKVVDANKDVDPLQNNTIKTFFVK